MDETSGMPFYQSASTKLHERCALLGKQLVRQSMDDMILELKREDFPEWFSVAQSKSRRAASLQSLLIPGQSLAKKTVMKLNTLYKLQNMSYNAFSPELKEETEIQIANQERDVNKDCNLQNNSVILTTNFKSITDINLHTPHTRSQNIETVSKPLKQVHEDIQLKRCIALYERQRQPHWCTHREAHYVERHSSSSRYVGHGHLNFWRCSKSHDHSFDKSCSGNSSNGDQSNGNATVRHTEGTVKRYRRSSQNSSTSTCSEFSFDRDVKHSRIVEYLKSTSVQSNTRRDRYSCSKIAKLHVTGSQSFQNKTNYFGGIPEHKNITKKKSSVRNGPHNAKNIVCVDFKQVPTVPISGCNVFGLDLSDFSSSHIDVSTAKLDRHVPDSLNDYPDPTPPTKSKSDVFNPTDYANVDNRALTASESLIESCDNLLKYLNKDLTTATSKVRALYKWLVSQQIPHKAKPKNLAADSPLNYLYDIRDQRSTYAELFASLCRKSDIPCVIIHGLAKGITYSVGEKVTEKKMQNSWNAVYVDDAWRLVHPYWAAHTANGYKTGLWPLVEDNTFYDGSQPPHDKLSNKHTNDFYFFADPDKFIYKCFPDNPAWQLLAQPLSKEEFEELPFLQPPFHELQLQLISHRGTCVIHTENGRVEVKLAQPEDKAKRYKFSYKLYRRRNFEAEGEYDEMSFERYLIHFVEHNGQVVFDIRFPVCGVFNMEVHCKDSKFHMPSTWVCTYKIICNEAMPDCEPLPLVPKIGWGPGIDLEAIGLVCLTHKQAFVNLDGVEATFIRFTMPKDRNLILEPVLLSNHQSKLELSNYVNFQLIGEIGVVQISPPKAGEYALQLFAREAGGHILHNVCNFLLQKTQEEEDIVIKTELARATEGEDIERLTYWITKFEERKLEDSGELNNAKAKLQGSKFCSDLKEAIARRNLDLLERILNGDINASTRRLFSHVLAQAELLRSRLKRLKRLQHEVLALNRKTISEMRSYPKPPPAVHTVMTATFMLLGNKEVELKEWSKVQALISRHGKDSLKRRVAAFALEDVAREILDRVRIILTKYDIETVKIASIGAATFYQWAITMAGESETDFMP